MPLVSVIIPVYNVEKTIKKCIDSIINQTFRDLEIIIVNDGSTDKSLEICKNYKSLDSRILLISKKNGGLSSARNAGITMSKAKYISFVDGDDFINRDMISRMINGFTLSDEVDITIVGHNVVDENYKLQEINTMKSSNFFSKKEALIELINDKNIHSYSWDKMYKRKLFEDVTFPEKRIFEDIATTYKLFYKSNLIYHCGGEPEINYYRNPNGITSNSEFNIEEKLKKKHHITLAYYERYNFFKDKKMFDIEKLTYKIYVRKLAELIKNFIRNKYTNYNDKLISFKPFSNLKINDYLYIQSLLSILKIVKKIKN